MNRKKQNGYFSRRNLLKASAFLGTGSLVTAILGSNMALPKPVVAQNNISPDEALQKLMEGNQRFIQRKRENPNQNMARLTEVAKGQNPFAAILGCADSRVPLEIIFDQGFGDLFVVRDAGNIATPEEVGSLEFGTLVLGAKVLMVIGHEQCGAVNAALAGDPVPGQIGSVLDAIKPAIQNVQGQGDQQLTDAIKANVIFQAEKLKSSSVISDLIQKGQLKVVGAYYDLDSGSVSLVSQ